MITFAKYATMLEDVYGVQYDRDEGFVVCPECQDVIYSCDWPQNTFKITDGMWYCPICDEWYNSEE